MKIIYTDGAIRKIEKDTVSASVFCIHDTEDNTFVTKSFYEFKSTNVRGELIAILGALSYCKKQGLDPTEQYFVTDNKFLRDAFAQNWISNWQRKDWKTAEGKDVKNKQLFIECYDILQDMAEFFVPIHIKSHIFNCSPLLARNKIVAKGLHGFAKDLVAICNAQLIDRPATIKRFNDAFVDFVKINSSQDTDSETFKLLAVMNTYVDVIAQIVAEASKQRYISFKQKVKTKQIDMSKIDTYEKSIYTADIKKIITNI